MVSNFSASHSCSIQAYLAYSRKSCGDKNVNVRSKQSPAEFSTRGVPINCGIIPFFSKPVIKIGGKEQTDGFLLFRKPFIRGFKPFPDLETLPMTSGFRESQAIIMPIHESVKERFSKTATAWA